MFKKFVAALAALLAATAFAAVDANKANQAELEAIKGIGPVISTLIINERKKGDYKDWNDLVVRVKGVGDKSAAKFSEGGLTVNGQAYSGPASTAPAKASTGAKAASGASKAAAATKETARRPRGRQDRRREGCIGRQGRRQDGQGKRQGREGRREGEPGRRQGQARREEG